MHRIGKYRWRKLAQRSITVKSRKELKDHSKVKSLSLNNNIVNNGGNEGENINNFVNCRADILVNAKDDSGEFAPFLIDITTSAVNRKTNIGDNLEFNKNKNYVK